MLLAVYGTLRKGQGFYGALSAPRYIRTATLSGYKMFSVMVPVIEESKDPEDTVVVDIINIGRRDYKMIERIEVGAGYRLEFTHGQAVEENNTLPIWVADGPVDHLPRIYSGDWVNYIAKKPLT